MFSQLPIIPLLQARFHVFIFRRMSTEHELEYHQPNDVNLKSEHENLLYPNKIVRENDSK